jgi:hypothetical protein
MHAEPRAAFGKAGKGALSGIHPQQLGATVLRESRDSRCGTAVYCSQAIA